MIRDIYYGDITNPDNVADIIIAMNTRCAEASAIGRTVLVGKVLSRELELGDVVTFKFDKRRDLHLLICHELGQGGWEGAEQFVRFGLDYLWRQYRTKRQFSIVRIGTGLVGTRDGADATAIHTAIADSYLPICLYIWDGEKVEDRVAQFPPLKPSRTWNFSKGEREIRLVS